MGDLTCCRTPRSPTQRFLSLLFSLSPRSIKFKSNNIPVALFPCPPSERADKYPYNGPLLEILLEFSLFYGSGLELQMVIIDLCLLMEASGENIPWSEHRSPQKLSKGS